MSLLVTPILCLFSEFFWTFFSLDAFPEMLCWVPGGDHEAIVPWAVVFTILYVFGIPIGILTLLLVKDGVIADVALVDHLKDAGPDVGVIPDVLVEGFLLDSDDLTKPFHVHTLL